MYLPLRGPGRPKPRARFLNLSNRAEQDDVKGSARKDVSTALGGPAARAQHLLKDGVHVAKVAKSPA